MVEDEKSALYYITIVYLSIILSGLFAGITDDKVYVVTAIYLILFFIWAIHGNNIIINQKATIFPTLFIIVWLYGIFLGFFYGNKTDFIIRNFAGMSCYILIVPFASARIFINDIKRILLFFARLSVFLSVFTWFFGTWLGIEYIIKHIPILNAYDGGVVNWQYTNIQYFNRELIYVAFCAALYELLHYRISRKQIFNVIIVILASFYEFFLNISDGDLLALILLTFAMLFFNCKKISGRQTVLACLLLFFYIVFSILHGSTPVGDIFSTKDGGNSLRLKELQYFLSDFNILGHGLGSELYFSWRTSYDYGTELIYFNLFHKFGVFAFIICFGYIYTVIKAVKFMNNNEGAESVIPLALMGYLLPSLANPMLFGIIPVICHCLALMFIEGKFETK